MKKLLSLILITTLACSTVDAQQKRLKEIVSDSGLSYVFYGYKDNRVDSIYQESAYNNSYSYRIFKYDDNGNNTEQMIYSKPENSAEFDLTDKIYYTYDEMNREVSRAHYYLNYDGGKDEYAFAGIFVYEYKDDMLSTSTLYNDEELTDVLEVMEYSYNTDDQIDYVRHFSVEFGAYIEDYGEKYTYDEGKLDEITFYQIDFMSGQLTESQYRKFIFDANNNLKGTVELSAERRPVAKHDYKYDMSMLSADVIYPVNNDDGSMLYNMPVNAVSEDQIFLRDSEQDRLVLVDTDRWSYEDADISGIYQTEHINTVIIRSLTYEKVVLNNVDNGDFIRIHDASGRTIMKCFYDNGVNIKSLPSGVYMLSVNGNTVKIRK